MEIVEAFQHRVRHVENLWIPLPDGIRLAARAWIPEGADDRPVPAVLEYIPYRKGDVTRQRDEAVHPFLAGYGYACLRVDLRGSGDSDGLLTDEYLPRELDDGEALLAWIAEQTWCNGSVGMLGISWGGFNGLQLAARRPPALKAVVSVSSTDDRYTDDVHYMGGCLLAENFAWAGTMCAHTSLPPHPAQVGERWRTMWHERMKGSGYWLSKWLAHQHRDDYWRYGSVIEDYDAIDIPVMAVSGWADGYSNSVFRLMKNLRGPRAGLIGPWGHKYAYEARPGPAIDFLGEVVRWFDRWLKGVANGVEAEPMLRVWMQGATPPDTTLEMSPGRWIGEDSWPSPSVQSQRYPLHFGRIVDPDEGPGEGLYSLQSPLSVGLFAGRWCSFSATPDLPHDQREEDGGALVFDSDLLAAPVEILGAPVIQLRLSADRPVAQVAARLSKVAPNGETTRVTYGLLNLTHRDRHARPQPLAEGVFYAVEVRLNEIAQCFPAGHRLRVAISSSYWPLAWPTPEPVRLTLDLAGCALTLPLRLGAGADAAMSPLGEPRRAPRPAMTVLRPRAYEWRVIRDLLSNCTTMEVKKDEGGFRFDRLGLSMWIDSEEHYRCTGNDHASARAEKRTERRLACGDWDVRVVTRTWLSADSHAFHLRAEMDGYENERRVHSHNLEQTIPRDLV